MYVGRQPLQQERNDPMDLIGVDEMVVIENYGQVVREVGELVDKGACQPFNGRRSWRTQRGENTLPDLLLDSLERGHQVGEKACRVVVCFVERNLGDTLFVRPGGAERCRRDGDAPLTGAHKITSPATSELGRRHKLLP